MLQVARQHATGYKLVPEASHCCCSHPSRAAYYNRVQVSKSLLWKAKGPSHATHFKVTLLELHQGIIK